MTDWFSEERATFGDRLAHARETAGMSQAELARRLGVSTRTVAAWEDDRSEPRSNRTQMVAGILNVSLMWLLSGRGEGVGVPDDGRGPADAEISAALTDLRLMRAELDRMAERVARTEQRLRRYADDGAAA